jgi:exodeoxyribonuclease VII large subunit
MPQLYTLLATRVHREATQIPKSVRTHLYCCGFVTIDTQVELLSVSELTSGLNRHLRQFGDGWVEGEVQNWYVSPRGHAFFALADEASVLQCRMWAQDVPPRERCPDQGQLIAAHFERPEVWGAKGRLQLSVDVIRATGEGELLRRQAETLKLLQRDGLTDPRRRPPLPTFPRRVGLIAGRGSDAREDVITHLRDRFPPVEIAFCAAAVEGRHAVVSIIEALARLSEEPGVEVIVVARGGGSVTDLFPFSDERLCRAIFACGIPVVTSIGHTRQRPNCDHVAAACAHVPAKTAELVVPSAADLTAEIGRFDDALNNARRELRELRTEVADRVEAVDSRSRLQRTRAELTGASELISVRAEGFYGARRLETQRRLEQLARGRQRVVATRERLEDLSGRVNASAPRIRRRNLDYETAVRRHEHQIRQAADRRVDRMREQVRHLSAVIRARDFRARGWMLAATTEGQPVRSAAGLAPGDRLELHLHDGHAAAKVEQVETSHQGEEH